MGRRLRRVRDRQWRLTIHSSRSRFAARLNSGVSHQMILEAFMEKLREQLPGVVWSLASDAAPTVVFPAISEDFGDIDVTEQDGELTVNFGRFTHSHFCCYDNELTETQKADLIAADTVACLADVFADRLEFYGSHSGIGGFRRRGTQGALSRLIVGRESRVWSGRDG